MFNLTEPTVPSITLLSLNILLSFVVIAVVLLIRSLLLPSNYPPGPFRWPIVGNILKLSLKGTEETLAALEKKYGDLVFFRGLGNNLLVLNSIDVMNDLLDKRGHIYSDRPIFTVAGELMGADQTMIFMSSCEDWREQRKIARVALSPFAVQQYRVMLERSAAALCRDLIDKPSEFFSSIRFIAGKIMFRLAYGIEIESPEDQFLTTAEEVSRLIEEAAVPGVYICDLIPFLKHLPAWVPFRKKAILTRAIVERGASGPFERAQRDISQGIAQPSLVENILTSRSMDPNQLRYTKWAAGSLYTAGIETTNATVLTFIMAMALNPKIQELSQAEIDRVVGSGRLPQIQDKESLPYLSAVIKETTRWHAVVPLSVARRTSADDWYKGYYIPKGTIIIPNVRSIASSDDGKYDPKAFIPERFLDEEHPPIDPDTWIFGFGRRVCPGKALAENLVFILIASLISSFTFAVDESEGLTPEFTEDLVSHPKPFKCLISPRSANHKSLIQDALARDGHS